MLKALLIIAHGSRRKAANEEIEGITKQVKKEQGDEFNIVKHAFLEFAKPDITTVVSNCDEIGVKELVVVPYFLAAGSHVVRDIPLKLDFCREQYPEMTIQLLAHYGVVEDIAKNIAEHVGSGQCKQI